MTSSVRVAVEVEIDTDMSAKAVDMFHRWRRFVERLSNTKEYGVSIVDWRIPGSIRMKKE